ncbi:TRAP transporter large permease subunit [Aquibacillus halophilus]|uniref:TRAP transporter large permease subunit n=1 Tax=Aquibacillus halophilus TaxID=930132 RepID=A0A6A8DIX2_9BACI|nr:TRAP transporter large permease [Aquibacillus halophilus]MRH41252.1 TRAP transporter large permease subunit [Aquibacillus halophilus]
MSGIWIIVLFAFFIIIRLPLAFSMAIPAVIYLSIEGIPIHSLSHRMINAVNSYTLLAVPLFIFAGNLMNSSGLTDRIFKFILLIVGNIRGGLAQVNVLASLVFSGISGSALADIGGIGKVLIHTMNSSGYNQRTSAGITAASATIGPIFPPSIPLIIFAVVAQTSAVHLLIAGIIPALLLTGLLMLQIAYMAKKYKYPKNESKTNFKELSSAFLFAIPAIMTPVILIGGLLFGFFGPTELAAFTVLYIVVLGKFVYKKLTMTNLLDSFKETVRSTAIIMFIISAASIFAWTLTVSQISLQVTQLFLGITTNPILMLLITAVLLLLIGTIFESMAAILVFTPILLPPLTAAGVDPIHFGIVMIFTLMLGLLTPPVGMSLYLVSSITNLPMEEVIKGVLPYFIVLSITLLLIILFPQLSLWLPTLFY